ncbi:histidine kinase N-terminal 7TM domain-containing protein [Natrialbaceae archaeon A-CW3]
MSLEVSALGLAFLGTGIIILGFLHKPLTRPDTPGSTAFAVTVFGCALWPLSLSLGLLVDGEVTAAVAWSGRLVAPTVLTVGWFLLAVRITTDRHPQWWLVAALAGYVGFELIVLATNPFHHVGFDPAVVAGAGGITPDWNAWFWIQATINYVLMASATVILAAEAIRATGLRRRQSALLAIAVVPTGIANLMTISGLVQVPHDLSPFGFVGSAIIMSWALYRAEFLDIVPIARKTALEELPHAVVTLGSDGRVIDFNAVARQYFNAEAGIGAPTRAFFANVADETVAAFESGEMGHRQVRIETDEGTRYFDCTASAVGSDPAAGRVLVFRDVTDRIHRERQLLEQNETLSEFANIVSHDLQGPLMEVRSSATLAVQTGEADHVEHVLEGADRMERLVDDLLELARSGRQIDDPVPVSLESVAGRAWGSVWTPEAELSVEADCTIAADPDRLQQLLENLFRNAVEHGSSNHSFADAHEGDVEHTSKSRSLADAHEDAVEHNSSDTVDRVTFTEQVGLHEGASSSGTLPADSVSVVVRAIPGGFAIDDDGSGIAPERRTRVFDRGFTSSPNGTGLGLAIVEQISTAHGWSIDVTESPEGGARFALTGVSVLETKSDPDRMALAED